MCTYMHTVDIVVNRCMVYSVSTVYIEYDEYNANIWSNVCLVYTVSTVRNVHNAYIAHNAGMVSTVNIVYNVQETMCPLYILHAC